MTCRIGEGGVEVWREGLVVEINVDVEGWVEKLMVRLISWGEVKVSAQIWRRSSVGRLGKRWKVGWGTEFMLGC